MQLKKIALTIATVLPVALISTTAMSGTYGQKPGKIYNYYGYNTVGTKHGDIFLRPDMGGRPPVALRADPSRKSGGDDLIVMANQPLKVYGGRGADRFVIHHNASYIHDDYYHHIMDFKAAEGDIIDLSFIKGKGREWSGLTFIGSAQFAHGVAGQVRFKPGMLEISPRTWDEDDGDEALIQVRLHGVNTLSESSLALTPDADLHALVNKLMKIGKKKKGRNS